MNEHRAYLLDYTTASRWFYCYFYIWTYSNFLNNILVQGNYVAYEANLEKTPLLADFFA